MGGYQRIKRVLVVEDNPLVRTMLTSFLELLGLEWLEAANGAEAIEIFIRSNSEVDLLVTDFRMQKVDGVQLLDWCRKNQIHIPVILTSANADLVQREQVALADCCATLMFKPINLEVFTSAIGAADARSHHRDCVHFRKDPVI